MGSKKNFDPKGAFTPEEGIEAGTPNTRVQNDQNAPKADDGVDITVDGAPKKATKNKKGSRLKQEVASEVIVDSKGGAVGGSGGPSSAIGYSNLKTMAYSGDAGTILGNAASTPIVGKPDRADSRFGKKLDATNKRINYLAAERVINEYSGPVPLSQANGVQGYNGTPQNDNVRLQKNAGATNAELMFDRSVDELVRDEFFFTSGQVIKQDDVQYDEAPTLTVDQNGLTVGYDAVRGNYVNRGVKITVAKKDGVTYVKAFKPDTVDLGFSESMKIVNVAGSNHVIDMNAAEENRITMDAKAGDETKPNWSPLPRAIQQPSQTIAFLRDIENDVGSYLLTSMRFASKSLSYQINKASKDGIREVAPMREMFTRHLSGLNSSVPYEDGGEFSDIFEPAAMKAGSAAFMIAFRDSVNKYKTKADVLTMPLSLKSHYEVARSHHDVFRCKENFYRALDSRDAFSTIDRDYDPMSPVCITDGVQLISPLSWSKLYSYDRTDDGTITRSQPAFAYSYVINKTVYTTTVEHPILKALDEFAIEHSRRIWDILTDRKKDDGEVEWYIPVRSTTRSFSLWDFLLCSLTPKMEKIRANSMWDVLNYERGYEYPFTQLQSISSYVDAERTNYKFSDVNDRLETKQMKESTAVTWKMPELFWNPGDDTDLVNEKVIVHPFYFDENRYLFTSDSVATLKEDCGSMLFPVTRAGIILDQVAALIEYGERPLRLSYDMMVRSPYETGTTSVNACVYKYSQNADGIFSIISNTHPDIVGFLSTPRELGWSFVAPLGVITNFKVLNTDSTKYRAYNYGMYDDNKFIVTLTPSYRVTCYHAFRVGDTPNDTLSVASVNVNRGEDFKQSWDEMASYDYTVSKAIPKVANGIEPSATLVFKSTRNSEASLYSAFTTGFSATGSSLASAVRTTAPKIRQLNRGLWTRVQKLPFIINPFDTALTSAPYDPFDIAYLFNFVGFLSSDYNEDIANRMLERQTYEYSYVNDPFIKDSYLFK